MVNLGQNVLNEVKNRRTIDFGIGNVIYGANFTMHERIFFRLTMRSLQIVPTKYITKDMNVQTYQYTVQEQVSYYNTMFLCIYTI